MGGGLWKTREEGKLMGYGVWGGGQRLGAGLEEDGWVAGEGPGCRGQLWIGSETAEQGDGAWEDRWGLGVVLEPLSQSL